MIDIPFIKYLAEHEFVFEYFISFCLFAPWKDRRKFWFLILPIYFALCLGGIDFIPVEVTYKYPMIVTSLFIVCIASFKLDFFETIFYVSDSYALQFAASCLAFVSVPFIDKYFPNFTVLYFTHEAITYATLFATIYFVLIRKRKGKAVKLHHVSITATSFLGISFFIFLSMVYKNDWHRFFMSYQAQNVVMLLFTFVGLAIVYIDHMNTKHKKMEDEQKILELMIRKEGVQYERTKDLIERINIREHDLRHQQELRELTNEEKEELEEITSSNIARFSTGNASIDIILSEQAYICHKKNIQLLCNVNGQLLHFMKPAYIASLFNNAINNAVNYLEQIEDTEKKIVRVSLSGTSENIILVFQNYLKETLETENNLPKTTAKDKGLHGYGLKSIQNIVTTYDGFFTISQENNTFTLIIHLSEPVVQQTPLYKQLTKGLLE